ncbi:MAG: hypothetical protein LRY41_01445 [Candidatus Pacebacteria bacterium]|nr:hypothetical protein [Candidatus Paceibacterota bacterium]MCD8527977.1 hypothetical protein [Candidatus Paceibacterota bacterium]
MGFTFLWAFLDKTFGLGLATPSAQAWVSGASPTTGFLLGVQGPFATFFQGLAGNPIIDWIFMLGLLFVGVTLLVNRWVRLGGLAGMVMMLIVYAAVLWPSHNPFIEYQLIYAVVLGYIGMKSWD